MMTKICTKPLVSVTLELQLRLVAFGLSVIWKMVGVSKFVKYLSVINFFNLISKFYVRKVALKSIG